MSIAESKSPILVTRSEPGASVLVEALRNAGYTARRLPVLEIQPLDDPHSRAVVAELDRFDVVIFVSGHAVRLGVELIDAVWPERPRLLWIAVGAATADALRGYGIAALVPATESSEGILALPQLSDVVGRRVLICAGRDGRSLLSDGLSRRGATVERLDLYTREPTALASALKCLPEDREVAAVVISSVDGGRAFASIWRAVGGDSAVVVVAPSSRVAAALREMNFRRVVEADGAGAQSVIAALKTLDGESR
jgi:uroporphyrinogen-III synthase